jgi:hypothetical protein
MQTTIDDLTRVNNDTYGNPRYVVHFKALASDYATALKISRGYGGRKFNNKQYGGGIVFQCYNTDDLVKFINENREAE